MTLLKKIGRIALEVTKMVVGFGPVVTLTMPPDKAGKITAVMDTMTQIQDVIVKAEIMGQALSLPGPDKLKMSAPAVAQVILASSVLVGRSIENPELFSAGATKVSDGMADILNSLKDNVDTEDHD